MEPLSPNDPLLALLRKAKPVEPRPDFTQNVMRAMRQTPQKVGFWERVQNWFPHAFSPRMAFAFAVVAVIGMVLSEWLQPAQEALVMVQNQPEVSHLPAVVDEMLFSVTEQAATLENSVAQGQDYSDMDPMGLLLVQEDTSALTDSEIALLVY